MATTISSIQSNGDYFRRSDEAGTPNITAAKKLEAAALALEDIHSRALFRFAQRRQQFDYLDQQSEYSLLDALRLSDYRANLGLRLTDNNNTDDFDFISPNEFSVQYSNDSTKNNYTIEYRDGRPVLRIATADLGSSTQLHKANDHDANGTWAVDSTNSDATNIGTDSGFYKKNSGSISFDINVSQSVNNKATISVSDMTAVDLSSYDQGGLIRMWVYIPDVGDDTSIYISSVEFRWGSDSSNYWSRTVTRPVDHAGFVDRWNLFEFKWNDATKTGSPDSSAIDYLLVTINYNASQGNDTDFRINDIMAYLPTNMEFLYFSNYTARTTGGIWIPRATATTDEMLIPDDHKMCAVSAYNWIIMRMLGPTWAKEADYWYSQYEKVYLPRLITEWAERDKLPNKKLRPQIAWSD